jgi:hypothetical protein
MQPEALCALIGFLGIAVFCFVLVRAYRKVVPVSRLGAVAIGAGVFSLASGMITVVSRIDFLHDRPEQVYADRYLLWPSLFWASLGLLCLPRVARARPLARTIMLALLLVLVAVPLATQRSTAIWSAIVYRNAQANAAAVESGVYDEAHFPGVDVGRERTLREIALLREKRIAMFADGAWQRVGTRFTGVLRPSTDATVQARWLDPVTDPTELKLAGHFEGFVASGAGRVQKYTNVALLDDAGTIAGLAEWSFIGPNAPALLLHMPRKRGFDGYVRDYDPRRSYTVVSLDLNTNTGIVLAALPVTRSAAP